MQTQIKRTELIPHDVLAQLLELSRREEVRAHEARVASLGTVLVTCFITFSVFLMLRMLIG